MRRAPVFDDVRSSSSVDTVLEFTAGAGRPAAFVGRIPVSWLASLLWILAKPWLGEVRPLLTFSHTSANGLQYTLASSDDLLTMGTAALGCLAICGLAVRRLSQ